MPSRDEFLAQVRDALHHLYDYHYLESHPLTRQFWPGPVGQGPSRAQRLSRLLLESIEELNPPDAPTRDASRAQYYALLVYRYVEEWSVADAARELRYSRSTFFREQRRAVTMLASLLREKLASRAASPARHEDVLHAEASRVLAQRERVDLYQVVQGVFDVARHLAEECGVALERRLDPGLPSVGTSRTLLRQVLLEALSTLIRQPGTRRVTLSMCRTTQAVTVELTAEGDHPARHVEGVLDRDTQQFDSVHRLVEMMGGRWLRLELQPQSWECVFSLPADSEKTVLVIEDNEAIIRVFEGYLADYHYQVIGATSGAEALRLAHGTSPMAVTLDVMMPTQDGWEILQALKNDPATRHIPVIICSVLQDPELARLLGAAGCLRKPISQADLLAALDSLSLPS